MQKLNNCSDNNLKHEEEQMKYLKITFQTSNSFRSCSCFYKQFFFTTGKYENGKHFLDAPTKPSKAPNYRLLKQNDIIIFSVPVSTIFYINICCTETDSVKGGQMRTEAFSSDLREHHAIIKSGKKKELLK